MKLSASNSGPGCPGSPNPSWSTKFFRLSLVATALLFSQGVSKAAPTDATFVNFEGKQTHPVALSPDGTRLCAVHTPDARLSVFDRTTPSNPILIGEIPVGLEPVSVNALN